MSIILHVEPNTSPMSMREFVKKAPKFSIAIDGYVAGPTDYKIEEDEEGNITQAIVNFNHHEGVNRAITMATCEQIAYHFRTGMLENFRQPNGEIQIDIFTNDADEDIILSCFLLFNLQLVKTTENPILNKLIAIEGKLDATSGLYPISKDSPLLRELAWMFDPFYKAKFNGLLATKDADIYTSIITDGMNRIKQYVVGNGDKLPINSGYKVLGGGAKWKLVEEQGIYSKSAMVADGINSFVSVKPMGEGRWSYVIGKSAPFVKTFNLKKIFKELNTIEGLTADKWGGADTIGGSPRACGSKISPDEMVKIIEGLI